MKSLESMHTQISFCRPIQGERKVNDWRLSRLCSCEESVLKSRLCN